MTKRLVPNEAIWALLVQMLTIFLMLATALFVPNKLASASLALGGVICLLPNLYLYRSVFKHFGASKAKNILKGLYWGEIVKIFLTIGLFGGVLVYCAWVLPLYLFLGYFITQIVFWLPPVLMAVLSKKIVKFDDKT